MSEKDKNLKRNESGCLDMTAYNAIHKDDEHKRFDTLLHCIKDMCADAGFTIEGRIVLIDQYTGKVWR